MAHYVPKIGAVHDVDLQLQFEASRYDSLSFRTTPIELLGYGDPEPVVSHATGFFWEQNGEQFLITNRHVVTGRNTFTNEYLTPALMQPQRIRYFEVKWHEGALNRSLIERIAVEIDLFIDGRATFLQDPEFNRYNVDIVAIPLPQKMHSTERFSPFVNHYNFEPLLHMTGATCFIVGYPFRNYVGNMIPTWKSGTLASEPFFPVDNKPMFLLDALTKDGMSGSPVFRRIFGPSHGPHMNVDLAAIVTTEFVGVYSGRMASPEFVQAGLGIAWYANRIPRIIAQGTSPTFEEIHQPV